MVLNIEKGKDKFIKDKNYVSANSSLYIEFGGVASWKAFEDLGAGDDWDLYYASFCVRFGVIASELSNKLKFSEKGVIELLKKMIENGELRARLNEQKKTIMFIKSEEDYDSMKEKMVRQTEKIKGLMQELKELGDDIIISKEYQKKVIKGPEFNYDIDDLDM